MQLFSQMLVKFAKDIPWRSLCVIPHESKKSVSYTPSYRPNYGMNNRLDEWIKHTTDPVNVGSAHCQTPDMALTDGGVDLM